MSPEQMEHAERGEELFGWTGFADGCFKASTCSAQRSSSIVNRGKTNKEKPSTNCCPRTEENKAASGAKSPEDAGASGKEQRSVAGEDPPVLGKQDKCCRHHLSSVLPSAHCSKEAHGGFFNGSF